MNVNNATMKNKQTTKQNHSLFTNKLLGHVTKASGIEVFLIAKNESALAGTSRLVKDRSRKSWSIQERSFTKLVPEANCLETGISWGHNAWVYGIIFYRYWNTEKFIRQ